MINKALKSKLTATISASVLFATLISCSASSNDKDKSEQSNSPTDSSTQKGGTESDKVAPSVSADTPVDSTGAVAALALNFGRLSSGVALGLQSPITLDLGNGIVLADARISIGSIKLKANKEMDETEKALKAALKEEKKSIEAALEADKKALELEKEAIEKKYEPQFEGADEAAKDALKEQMKAEQAAVEVKLAALEATKEAELSAKEEQSDGNVKWKGPYIYNMIDNSVSPTLPEVQLNDGSYRRIEFKIKPNRSVEATDALLNNAIILSGTAMINNVATPFNASFRIDEEFKLMGAGAFKVEASVSNTLTIAFNPLGWFAGIDFTVATPDSTGSIAISQTSNSEIWEMMRKNIKRSTKFGKDDDNDGSLREEESEGDGDEGVEEEEKEEKDNEESGKAITSSEEEGEEETEQKTEEKEEVKDEEKDEEETQSVQ